MASVIVLTVRAVASGFPAVLRQIRRLNDDATRSIRRGWSRIGTTIARSISDGMANGIGNGLRTAMSNPYVAAAVLALAVAVATALGAALAATLVLVIGGAFIALGGIIAAQSPIIQRNWKKAVENVKKDWATVGDALVEPMHRAIHTMEGLSKRLAPYVRDAMTAAAPHVETFFNRMLSGFEELGKRASKPLEEAFNVLLDALGPEMEDVLAGMGDALGALGRTVRDHSTEIAIAFGMVFRLITLAIDIINAFANGWVLAMHTSGQAIGIVIKAAGTLVDAMFLALSSIVGGLETITSKIPGMGHAMDGVHESINRLRDKTREDFRTMGDSFLNAGRDLDNLNKRRKIEVDIQSLQSKLAIAREDLKKTGRTPARARAEANIRQLEAQLREARRQLTALNGAVANVYVKVNTSQFPNFYGPGLGLASKATGGNVGAANGGNRVGSIMVGEHGPERVDLPAGSHVNSNSDTRRKMAQGANGQGMDPFVLVVQIAGETAAELLIDPFTKAVKRRGGVEATFGKL